MNFTDAVRELTEGRCEGISCSDCIYENRNGFLNYVNAFVGVMLDSEDILSDNWELVNPKPEYEEVEVTRYMWKHATSDGIIVEKYSEELPFLFPNVLVTKLTGMIKKEIKPKVKMRKEFNNVGDFILCKYGNAPKNAKVILEWEK